MTDDQVTKVIEWVRSDFWIIIILLLALLGCLYTINSVGNYQQAINDAWEIQWEQSGCSEPYKIPAIDYKYIGGYDNEINDQDQNT